ncbi:MAG: TonB-dependent receptor [Phaeodactylibacter sp.]|uniref:TonB-dependent receptor plug domain-containing protein n=1 Tax=Phaeodactylibacter sp. TaxID=1940289 RepID=UPI0032EFB0F2
MQLKSTLLTLLALLPAWLVQAQVEVRGAVLDSETALPIAAVVVTLDDGTTAVSDEKGAFTFFDVPEGAHDFTFRSKESYIEQTLSTTVSDQGDGVYDLGKVRLVPTQREEGITNKEDFIPTITLSDGDLEQETDNQNISGVLAASRDVFVSAAAFTFGPARFRIRGYDSENTAIYINGVPFNELENGRAFWSALGGLNDVTRNRSAEIGLSPLSYAFGGVGGGSSIDTRASSQREQTRLTMSATNRGYRWRTMLTHSTGMMDNGWAFSFSGSHRWAQEGYEPGSFYDAYAYFLAVDRKLGDKHLLNLTAFGAPTKRGRAGASTPEMYELADNNYYNPFWGYQNGEKRNSRISNIHQPVIMLRHDWQINENATLTTTASYQFGRVGSTALNWFEAPDPRPDYYRNLPSYFESIGQPEAASILEQDLRNNESSRQINWDQFYEVNRTSQLADKYPQFLEGQEAEGRWAQYMVEDRRYDSEELDFYTNYNHVISDIFTLSGGLSYQTQTIDNFKVIEDLLGADYFVDIDAFAVRDFPDEPNVQQSDLNNPNRVVREGDRFGWDYDIDVRRAGGWLQGQFILPKFDIFAAIDASQTRFWRTGKYRTGRFPDQSFGESEKQTFNNLGVKGGITYKIDGRNYLFANGTHTTRAPFVRNAYVSPRTRDQLVPGLESETIYGGEVGYLLRSPNIQGRASLYYTQFDNRTEIIRFYNDLQRAFGSLVMTGQDQLHQGAELAIEAKVTPSMSIRGVAAIGEFVYNSNAQGALFGDDQETFELVNSEFEVYQKGLKVPGRPQNAYTLGLNLRPKGFWFAYLNFNYFDNVFIDFNPISRSPEAVIGLEPNSLEYDRIVAQRQTDGQFTVDLFGGKSFKFGKTYLYINGGINNILNNTEFITGGFDQLRFDFDTRTGNDSVFQPRYYYLYGRNFFVNVSLRL